MINNILATITNCNLQLSVHLFTAELKEQGKTRVRRVYKSLPAINDRLAITTNCNLQLSGHSLAISSKKLDKSFQSKTKLESEEFVSYYK